MELTVWNTGCTTNGTSFAVVGYVDSSAMLSGEGNLGQRKKDMRLKALVGDVVSTDLDPPAALSPERLLAHHNSVRRR